MSSSLPSHPNLDWLRKSAKQRLSELRAADPACKARGCATSGRSRVRFPELAQAEGTRRSELSHGSTTPAAAATDYRSDHQRILRARRLGPDRRRPQGPRRRTADRQRSRVRTRSGVDDPRRCTWPSKAGAAICSICCSSTAPTSTAATINTTTGRH